MTELLTMDEVANRLRYDPATGIFTWRVRVSTRTKAGDVAGKVRADGYRIIKIDGRDIYAHRLAWFLTYGQVPTLPLDHINGNRDDNSIANLREATASQNTINQKLRSDNRSGYRGVQWSERHKKWRARIKVDGETTELGYFDTALAASNAYEMAADRLHGAFVRGK